MKKKLIILIAVLLAATSLVAQEQRRRPLPERITIVARDGKLLDIDGEPFLLGGKRAFLGILTTDLTPQLREHFGAEKDSGVLVGSVEAGSPAEKAGVKVGDILVAVEGKEVTSLGDIRRALRDKKEGDSLRLEVLRGRNRQTLVASVIEKDFDLPRYMRALDPEVWQKRLGPEWNARVFAMPNCDELQTRIKDLETRLKDLEKKLQK